MMVWQSMFLHARERLQLSSPAVDIVSAIICSGHLVYSGCFAVQLVDRLHIHVLHAMSPQYPLRPGNC